VSKLIAYVQTRGTGNRQLWRHVGRRRAPTSGRACESDVIGARDGVGRWRHWRVCDVRELVGGEMACVLAAGCWRRQTAAGGSQRWKIIVLRRCRHTAQIVSGRARL